VFCSSSGSRGVKKCLHCREVHWVPKLFREAGNSLSYISESPGIAFEFQGVPKFSSGPKRNVISFETLKEADEAGFEG
jgi:hypothetical protein